MKTLTIKELPKPFPFKKLIGPSIIILGLGLGSGELILWPYLTANYGMGIIWGALVGITLQFIINMEVERYALVHGESIFVGYARKFKWLPVWFLLSTFIPWMWPGIISASATVISSLVGVSGDNIKFVTIGLLVLIGLLLSLGPVLYKTQENLQKFTISIGVPTIFLLSIILAKSHHWVSLLNGIRGAGDGYFLLPAGISLATFLGALAYAGAGGNLNLAQSFYVREKGYGMGSYAEKIRGILFGSKKEIKVTGYKFEPTKANINRFKIWWRNMNIEHFIFFWLTGAITITLLGFLSFITVYSQNGGSGAKTQDISFLFSEAQKIGGLTFPVMGIFFLIVAALTLFGCQLGVFDATSRILAENVILASQGKIKENKIAKVYYMVLWSQIASAITILMLGFTQPLQLVITAAVLNAFAMFVHTGLTIWTNNTILDK